MNSASACESLRQSRASKRRRGVNVSTDQDVGAAAMPYTRTHASSPARDYLLDICPNASLKHPAILSPRPAMSNETQKADQIAHRLYSKLALVVNHARATREPPPNAKVDRWVRSAVLSVPALY